SGIVTVCVIDALEMINVHHRDRKRMFKPNQGVIEGAAGIQTREFVLVRERVGILDDAAGEDESGDSEICCARPARGTIFESEASREKRPEHPIVDGLMQFYQPVEQKATGDNESKQ